MISHDVIDNIERDFFEQEGLHLVGHYDPVATDDPRLPAMRELIAEIAAEIHPAITIHDLRMVPGVSHTNIVFDCVLPYSLQMDGETVKETIASRVIDTHPCHYCVITTERSFVRCD